jgi:tetratricopeptide (TPR) repeat protein
VLAFMAAGARADETQWRDMESRIQYGYYTEDSRALQNLQAALAVDESHDQLRGYYAALVAWRLAQLAVQHPAPQAASPGQLAQRCVSALDGVLEAQADYAEALALRAACLGLPLAAGGLHAPFAGRKPRKDIERALQLAPRDPRVLLLDALGDYELPPTLGGNKERALVKLRATVAAFEQERTSTEPLPGWGAAEAYLFLGRSLFEHGDAVAARDALEHALLLAPQYVPARALMAKITSG